MSPLARIAAAAAALTLTASAAEAAVSYRFTVDTSSIAGSTGYIELQLGNNGDPAFQNAFANVVDFQTDGLLGSEDPYATATGGVDDVFGHVSGVLPGVVTLSDLGDFAVSDYLHSFTFGTTLSFRVVLNGPALDAPACAPGGGCAAHSFALDLLDDSLAPVLNDPSDIFSNGFLLGRIDVDAGGVVTPRNFSPHLTLQAVPEPAAWALMILGFGAVGVTLRRRGPALS